MALIAVRVWLPDRPGALGAVASRVGALRGDVVSIDILERGAGRAVDELIIELPDSDEATIALLVQEIAQVDGVDVEDVRPTASATHDRTVESLHTALLLSTATAADDLSGRLVAGVRDVFEADWAALVDSATGRTVAEAGGDVAPSAEWLSAFVAGTGHGAGAGAVEELARVALPASGHHLVLARGHLPLRESERRILAVLAELADRRAAELTG